MRRPPKYDYRLSAAWGTRGGQGKNPSLPDCTRGRGGFMRRFPSVKKNSDFQTVYKNGKSYANKLLVMYVYETGRDETRIGISVSKKVGNSVVRHRVTRLVRESFRLHREKTNSGLDIIVVARAAAAASDYKKMERAYRHLCGLHNIIRESK